MTTLNVNGHQVRVQTLQVHPGMTTLAFGMACDRDAHAETLRAAGHVVLVETSEGAWDVDYLLSHEVVA